MPDYNYSIFVRLLLDSSDCGIHSIDLCTETELLTRDL